VYGGATSRTTLSLNARGVFVVVVDGVCGWCNDASSGGRGLTLTTADGALL
jgi:hypothetical protein